MNNTPSPEELKKKTAPEALFRREAEVVVAGRRFVVRRMTLAEELEWYALRERVLAEDGLSHGEKVAKIWEHLLQRVVVEPRLSSYVEELPTVAVARLVQAVSELHLWDMDFRISPQASG